MRYFLSLVVALVIAGTAHAERFGHIQRRAAGVGGNLSCSSITDISTLPNVLYKNENVHGGRGRTFLDQGHRFGGTRTLKVAGTNGKVYACFGLWACDQPFGCRYYQAMCHDSVSNRNFPKLAKANGGTYYALVGTGRGKCLKFRTDLTRYGNIRK
jgi:hypothetical protein